MQSRDYVKNVLVTESNNFEVIGARFAILKIGKDLKSSILEDVKCLFSAKAKAERAARNARAKRNIRLLHASIGITTEVGELFEMLKKDQILDLTNLKEEVGDTFWYAGLAVDELNLDIEKMVLDGKAKLADAQSQISALANEGEERAFIAMLLANSMIDSSILLDLLKKSAFYGKDLDVVKFESNLASFMTQMILLLAVGGFTVEEAMDVNIAKLRKRYGAKFTEQAAVTRNLDAERKILEGNGK